MPVINMITKPIIIGTKSLSAIFEAGTSGNAYPSIRRSIKNSIPRLTIRVKTWVDSTQLYM
jgi:hypothetical protein